MTSCEACGITVTGGDTKWSKHKKTKSHKTQTLELERCRRTLFIGRLPHWIKERALQRYFSGMGRIVQVKVFPNFAIVELESVEQCDYVLSIASHQISGCALRVEKKNYHPRPPPGYKPDQDSKQRNRRGVLERLRGVTGVEDQMMQLEAELKVTEAERRKRLNFRTYLQDVIRRYIPEVRLIAYGSTVSGLGMTGCDLDMMVAFDENISRKNLTPPPPLPWLGKNMTLRVSGGRVTLQSLVRAELWELVLFFRSLIQRSEVSDQVERYQPVPHARVPLLTAHNKTQQFYFDLSFGPNNLAIYNTRLIQLLLSLDDRVCPLVFTVKVWAKQTLVCNDATQQSLSSYALFLLLYLYLQNTQPPVLPSVEGLANLCGASEQASYMGWDCSFTECVSLIQTHLLPTRNSQNLPSLLQGFYDFYSNVNVLNTVLCPRTGEAVDVLGFRSRINSSPHLQTFRVKELNIQDPFELCHNTASNINLASARHISKAFIQASHTTHGTPGWDLLTVTPLEPCDLEAGRDEDMSLTFQVGTLPARFLLCKDSEEAVSHWFEWVLTSVYQVLKVMRIDYKVINEGHEGDVCAVDSSGSWTTDNIGVVEADRNQDVVPPVSAQVESGIKRPSLECVTESESKKRKISSGATSTSQQQQNSVTTIFDTPEKFEAPKQCKYSVEKRLQSQVHHQCHYVHRLWLGRRQARKDVEDGPLKDQDYLLKEEEVSRLLLPASPDDVCPTGSPEHFSLVVQLYTEGHRTWINLELADSDEKELTPLRPCLHKMIKTLVTPPCS